MAAAARRALFAVGEEVVYTPKVGAKPQPATVRFVGTLGGKEDLVGLEFLREGCGGCHDGFSKSLGQRGFNCPQGRGRYVSASHPRLAHVKAPPSSAQKSSDELHKLSVMGSNLEERMETNVLRQRCRVDAMSGVLRAQGQVSADWVKRWVHPQGRYLYFDRSSRSEPGRAHPPPGAVVDPEPEGGPEMRSCSRITSDYSGPHLEGIRHGEVSEAEARAVLDHVVAHPDVPLHADYLLPLVWRCVDLFGEQRTVAKCRVPEGGRVLVLGDTHGHMKDAVHVFRTFGPPSPTNVYLVNGDVCDRGDTPDRGDIQSVNIWTMILSYKVLYPGAVFLNRGNHEDWYTNEAEGPYGQQAFHSEIHTKYPNSRDATALKHAFRELFFNLPLAHTLGERVLVLHGGLWRAGFEHGHQRRCAKPVRLQELEVLNRHRDIPAGAERRVDMIMLDTCWSDPHEGNGILPNPRGGATALFGGDVTKSVLDREGLAMLVRSHDWPRNNEPHGHEWLQKQHHARPAALEGQNSICLSVFSASDYCGDSGNNGAVVEFTGQDGRADRVALHEWTADEAMVTWGPSWQSLEAGWRRAGAEQDLLWQLRSLVVEFKHELFAEFQAEDETRDFHVPTTIWAEVCGRVLGDFPWESLLGQDPSSTIAMPSVDDPASVCYTEFLARHQILYRNKMGRHVGFRRAIAGSLYESLMADDQPLRDTIAAIDPSGDGRVSVADLQSALSRVLSTVTDEQAWTLLRTTVAGAESGLVDVHSFLDSIQVRFSSTYAKPAPTEAPWVPGALGSIGRDILRAQRSTNMATQAEVLRRDHGRSSSGFTSGSLLGRSTSRSGVSRSSYPSMPDSFEGQPPLTARDRICSSASMLLTEFFSSQDKNGSGYLELEELKEALRPLPSCAGYGEVELAAIAEYCDLLGNGRINYLEFLHSFNVEASSRLAEELHEDLLEGIFRVLFFHYRSLVSMALQRFLLPGARRCTAAEFEVALNAVNTTEGLLAEGQIALLIDTLSLDEEGTFDFEEYFTSFEVVDTALGPEGEEADPDDESVVGGAR